MGTDREQAVAANRARLLAGDTPAVPEVEGDELLRSTVCARCGYDLNGLPAPRGTCPECGRAYGGPEVCLYGYAAGSNRTAWTRKPLGKRQLALRWTCVGVGLLVLYPALRPIAAMGLWYWPVSIVGGLAVATWRGLTEQPPDVVQVRLTPAGVRQLARGLGPIPYESVDAKPVPWRKVARAVVKSEADGLVRLRLGTDPVWWKLQVDHIDATVRCPSAAVAALRDRIAQWQGPT